MQLLIRQGGHHAEPLGEHSLTLTVEEAAALIGVSRSTAYDLVAADELSTVRLRRRILVPASALAVSPVEFYGALNRLRGRIGSTPSRPVGGGDTTRPGGGTHVALAEHSLRPSASTYDEPQLW